MVPIKNKELVVFESGGLPGLGRVTLTAIATDLAMLGVGRRFVAGLAAAQLKRRQSRVVKVCGFPAANLVTLRAANTQGPVHLVAGCSVARFTVIACLNFEQSV